MKKYLSLFRISFEQEFAFRLNFVMWRVRNILQIVLTYFLWSTVFNSGESEIFGYTRPQMMTYIFGIILIRALVFSARSVDVPGEISNGDLTNHLLKPINYFRYWAARDISSKVLNLVFSVMEFVILAMVLKPTLYIQTDWFYITGFVVALIVANYLIFIIRFIVSSITFWVPELAWGGQFLFMVIITEFLSGAVFPLDIFPQVWQRMFNYLPFPYLIFFPLKVYLGSMSFVGVLFGIFIGLFWSIVLTLLLSKIWRRGVRLYGAEGR